MKKKPTCLVLGHSWKNFHGYWLLGNCLYFEIWLYFHLCVQIHLLGGRLMKANFFKFGFLATQVFKILGFHIETEKVLNLVGVLTTLRCCCLQVH
jgi:hypothetical protein